MKEGDEVEATQKAMDVAPKPVIEDGEWVFLKIRRADLRVALGIGLGIIGAILWGAWALREALGEATQILRVR